MAKKGIDIPIRADNSDVNKKIKETTSLLDKMKKSRAIEGLAKAGATLSGAKAGFDMVSGAVSAAVAAVNELSEAFNEQKAAETALEQAAANNPYMNGESVSRLKEFATQMQQATGVADNELLPMLAQLSAAGRTEAESMAVVRAALDMAASGAMSFDSAARNLAKTYSGLAGELGETLPQVRALTAEQLKSGEAVKIISELYGGMAESVAESAGGQKKLSNAIRSAKEEIGAMFSRGTNGAQNFFAGLVQGWADARRAKREYEEAQESEIQEIESAYERARAGETDAKLEHVQNTIKNLQKQAEGLKKQREEFAKSMVNLATVNPDEFKGMSMEEAWDAQLKKYISDINFGKEHLEAISDLEKEIAIQKEIAAAYQEQITAEQEKQAQAAEEAARAVARAEADAAALEAIRRYREKVAAAEEEIRVRRELGEEITRTAELEEMAGVKTQAALEMIQEAGGNITTENSFFKTVQQDIAGMVAELTELENAAAAAEALEERIAGLEDLIGEVPGAGVPEWRALSDVIVAIAAQFDALKNSLSPEEAERIAGQIQRAKEQLALSAEEPATEWDALAEEAQAQAERAGELEVMAKQAADEGKLDLEKAYLEEAARLRDAAREKEKQAAEMAAAADAELWHNRISTAAGYVNDLVGTVSEACDLMSDTQDNLLSATLAELETAYLKGEMDEEEYNRKVSQAKKDAAKEQYKIQMWQWSAGIAQVLANIAVGISEAIKLGPAGIVSSALVAAAGAVQLASAIAAKPIPPSFATGGIVGGNSYHGDRVQANLNSREMVLNMGQQKNLFDAINAGNMGGGAVNVVVNNSASNLVMAEPVITKERIEIMIDARVNASLRAGRYDSALTAQERGQNGNFFGI